MTCDATNRPAIGPGKTSDVPPEAAEALNRYWNRLENSGLGWQSVRANHAAVRRCIRELDAAGRTCAPERIGEGDILYLREVFSDLSPDTARWYVALFGRFLALESGNDVVSRMKLRWQPAESHPHVDWLSEEEVSKVMNADLDAPEAFARDLMLTMGLRRVECIRLQIGDMDDAGALVRGKGGKPRRVPWSSRAKSDFPAMLAWRSDQIGGARGRDGDYVAPGNVFLTRTARPAPYSEMGTSFDGTILDGIRKASGVQFGNHTLRRTFARAAFRGGARIEVVAGLLGHSDAKTTMRYIGLPENDARNALENLKW